MFYFFWSFFLANPRNVNLQNLHLILPDAQLLAKVCRTNPGASLAQVTQMTQATEVTQSTKRRRVT